MGATGLAIWSGLVGSVCIHGHRAWLVWRAQGFVGARNALFMFIAQLAANALWTWLYFVWRLGAASFIEILVLWGLILATIFLFWRVSRIAGALLVPYLAWVSFASALTLSTWQLNPKLLG